MAPASPDRVDAATVRGWLDQPDTVTVLDVRTPAEFETAHIRGSYNLPLACSPSTRSRSRPGWTASSP